VSELVDEHVLGVFAVRSEDTVERHCRD
jgi:hypothetical protein